MFSETMSVEDTFGLFLLAFLFIGMLCVMMGNARDGRKFK